MDKLLLIQLLSAFLIGGFATAFVTFLAEKSPKKISAIFLSIPTTPVVGLFFVALILSTDEVVKILPMTPVTLALVLVFICAYIYATKMKISFFTDEKKNRIISIIVSLLSALTAWACCALPIAINGFNNFPLSLVLFLVLAICAHYLLAIRHKHIPAQASKLEYTAKQKFIRFILIGSLLASVVLLTKFLGVFWGALFSFFPAKYMSALVIVHYYYDENFLVKTFQNIAIGVTSPLVYVLSLQATYPSLGVYFGTLVSLCISSTHVLLLMFLLNGGFKKHVLSRFTDKL